MCECGRYADHLVIDGATLYLAQTNLINLVQAIPVNKVFEPMLV